MQINPYIVYSDKMRQDRLLTFHHNILTKMNKGIKKSGKVVLCFILFWWYQVWEEMMCHILFAQPASSRWPLLVLPENAHLAHSGAGMLFDKNVKISRIFFSAATSAQIGGKRCNKFKSRHCLQLGHLLDCWNGLFDTEHVCSADHPWWTPGATVNLPEALATVWPFWGKDHQRESDISLWSIYVQIASWHSFQTTPSTRCTGPRCPWCSLHRTHAPTGSNHSAWRYLEAKTSGITRSVTEVGVSQPIYLQMATGRETFEWFGS